MQCNTGKCQEKAWKKLLYRDRGRPRQLHKYIIIGKKLYRCTTDEIFKDFNITG